MPASPRGRDDRAGCRCSAAPKRHRLTTSEDIIGRAAMVFGRRRWRSSSTANGIRFGMSASDMKRFRQRVA